MSEEQAAKGRALLDRLTPNPGAIDRFPERFRRHTLEHLFGDVWQGEALALEERSLVTCTILVALAREMLYNPNWVMDAAQKLGCDPEFALAPPPYQY